MCSVKTVSVSFIFLMSSWYRDPYILTYDGTYYMYGTKGETAFDKEAYGFDVYKSKDLDSWEDGFMEMVQKDLERDLIEAGANEVHSYGFLD